MGGAKGVGWGGAQDLRHKIEAEIVGAFELFVDLLLRAVVR